MSNDSFARDFIALVKKGQRAAVERMLESDPSVVGATDEHGVSAILLAYYHGHPDVAQSLLALKPALDVFEASTVGDADRVRELLTKDPSLANAWSSDGFFPLGLAAFFKRLAAAKVLVAHGADVRRASKPAGFTPLHSAVADDEGVAVQELVRALLDAGADPNAQSAGGGTPLHTAAFTGNVAVLRMLLAAGGDATIVDKKEQAPLDIARERGQTEAAALLQDAVTRVRG